MSGHKWQIYLEGKEIKSFGLGGAEAPKANEKWQGLIRFMRKPR